MTEDENPERLCRPQYHLKETIRLVMESRRCISGANSVIEQQQTRLRKEYEPEKKKRELELMEWMRRMKLEDALFPLNATQMLRAVYSPRWTSLTLTVMDIQKV